MDKKYYVYMHTCPNGKKYIGITGKQDINDRWLNGYGYHTQIVFYRAIQKYGWDNIKHEILYSNLSESEAMELEENLIKKYKTQNRRYGYNVNKGGERTTLGYKFTDEQREKLSDAKSTKIICYETGKVYKNCVQAQKELGYNVAKVINKPNRTIYGNHWFTYDYYCKNKDNIRLQKSARKVICLETLEVFNSISEAAKAKLCNATSISENCQNKRVKSVSGLHWAYYDENITKEKANEMIEQCKKDNAKRKKVICVETKEIYESTVEAQNKNNCKHICDVCNGKRKTAGGYHWMYYKEEMNYG